MLENDEGYKEKKIVESKKKNTEENVINSGRK